MKVLLLEDVQGLGERGSVKEVKDGYARNYLLPRGLAAPATPSTVRTMQQHQRALTQRADRQRGEVEQLAATLEQAVLEVRARGGEGGKLFGSITAADVAEALAARGFEITKKQIALDEPIKTAGFYKVPVRIGQGVVAQVDLNVIATE